MTPPTPLPRGATWHAVWVLPVLALLGGLLMPWSDTEAPVMNGHKLQVALAQWQAWTAKRLEMANEAQRPKDGPVEVRIVPLAASAAAASAPH